MCCPTLFGLEGIVADELRFGGGLTAVRAENGRVLFEGDERTLAWANLNLRCAERVLIRLGSFPAASFDALFEGRARAAVGAVHPGGRCLPGQGPLPGRCAPFCAGLPEDHQKSRCRAAGGAVPSVVAGGDRRQIPDPVRHHARHGRAVSGYHGRRAAQARLPREQQCRAPARDAGGRYGQARALAGQGTADRPVLRLGNDRDRSGHDRAAARTRPAARVRGGKNGRASPPRSGGRRAKRRSPMWIPIPRPTSVGSDIDPACVQLSAENRAQGRRVRQPSGFEQADALERDYSDPGVLFANPPYGERLLDVQTAEKLYAGLGQALAASPRKQYILSSDPLFERCFGRKADKRRKLYNGMLKCELHMYFKHSPRRSAKTDRDSLSGFTKNS